jgi:hypothetical protein
VSQLTDISVKLTKSVDEASVVRGESSSHWSSWRERPGTTSAGSATGGDAPAPPGGETGLKRAI